VKPKLFSILSLSLTLSLLASAKVVSNGDFRELLGGPKIAHTTGPSNLIILLEFQEKWKRKIYLAKTDTNVMTNLILQFREKRNISLAIRDAYISFQK